MMINDSDAQHIVEHTRVLWEAMRGERIFITGGTGFVGSWLVASFVRANRELCLGARAVILTRHVDANSVRIAELDEDSSIDLHLGDGTDFTFPPGRFAFVIHAAAQPSFEPIMARPFGILETDAITTRRVLEFAHAADTSRMLFTSSGAVYGRQPADLERVDEAFGGAPLSTDTGAIYGQSKRLSELMCALYARSSGIGISIARLFTFVGPLLPLDEGYAVGNFMADALSGRAIRISGDGTPVRSYLYAGDLAIWLWTILFAGRSGRAYNTGASDAVTIGELARIVAEEATTRVAIDIEQAPQPNVAPARYLPDTGRAKSELGLQAWISVPDGVRRTLSWYRERDMSSTRRYKR